MKATSSKIVTVALAVLAIAFIGAKKLHNRRLDAAILGDPLEVAREPC